MERSFDPSARTILGMRVDAGGVSHPTREDELTHDVLRHIYSFAACGQVFTEGVFSWDLLRKSGSGPSADIPRIWRRPI